jgi:hypothetical protein
MAIFTCSPRISPDWLVAVGDASTPGGPILTQRSLFPVTRPRAPLLDALRPAPPEAARAQAGSQLTLRQCCGRVRDE